MSQKDRFQQSEKYTSVILDLLSKKLKCQFFTCRKEWNQSDELGLLLDRNADIDVLMQVEGGDLAGVSLRVLEQHKTHQQYDTITLRVSSPTGQILQYAKLKRLLSKPGFLRPYLTVHAVVRNSKLLIAVARTENLIEWIAENPNKVGQRHNPDGTRFLCVDWDDIESTGWFRLYKTTVREAA